MSSFDDELQKLAEGAVLKRLGEAVLSKIKSPTTLGLAALNRVGKFTRGGFSGFEEAGRRLESPIKGLREGWRQSSPIPAMEERARASGFASPLEAAAALKGTNPEKYKAMLGGGEHLLGTPPDAGKIRAMAEHLSRSGWTGSGKVTKYMPLGMKSWAVVPPALAIPSMVNAPAPTPTSEGGAFEHGLGELGGGAGMLLGTGIGVVPGMAMWYGGQRMGSRLGRIIDRVRGGADFRTAVGAPSPSEAAKQYEDIQRYYG